MMSIPDSFHDTIDDIRELTEENKILKNQLLSAHKEIEDLNMENFRLRTELQNMIKTVNTFKKICSTPEKKCATPIRKDKSLQRIISPHAQQTHYIECVTNKQKHNKETQTLVTHTPNKAKDNMPTYKELSSNVVTNPMQMNKQHFKKIIREDTKTRKLCVLSNYTQPGMLQAIEENFATVFDYCSYTSPNSNLKILLASIPSKIEHFTMTDYCIIVLGETDIKTNDNFIDLVKLIRESLINVTHTNIIICVPTYVCGAPIYNYKIEMFNNLLCLDIQNNKYAYIFDSNHGLTFDMFSNISGRLNKNGIKCIFSDIMNRIKIDIELFPDDLTSDANAQNPQFFLLQ